MVCTKSKKYLSIKETRFTYKCMTTPHAMLARPWAGAQVPDLTLQSAPSPALRQRQEGLCCQPHKATVGNGAIRGATELGKAGDRCDM